MKDDSLGESCGRDAGTGVGVADETTVAATVQARVRARVGRKVAVAATPDTTSSPVIGDAERYLGVRGGLPTRKAKGIRSIFD